MEHRETMDVSATQWMSLPTNPCAGLNIERVTAAYRVTFDIFPTDGVQSLLPEVPRDAPLDGDEKGTVPRPEGDDGIRKKKVH